MYLLIQSVVSISSIHNLKSYSASHDIRNSLIFSGLGAYNMFGYTLVSYVLLKPHVEKMTFYFLMVKQHFEKLFFPAASYPIVGW